MLDRYGEMTLIHDLQLRMVYEFNCRGYKLFKEYGQNHKTLGYRVDESKSQEQSAALGGVSEIGGMSSVSA